MRSLFLLAGTITAALADPHWKRFIAYKAKYELIFNNQEEDAYRFQVFKTNMQKAADLNEKSAGKATFGESKFAHLTKDEFKKTHLGYKPTEKGRKLLKSFHKKKHDKVIKKSVDWRETSNCVSPVKDQGQCGSCWAFSATEATETGYCLNTGSMLVLAPQQITSCDNTDLGCGGGDTPSAYEYIREAGGLEEEKDYPYQSGVTERTGRCHADSSKFEVKVGETSVIATGASDEGSMLTEIQTSPMSICVDAESWQLYLYGVVDRSTCGVELDHCVHLVGYKGGADNYWIVKNSWAAGWGEEGYIYVRQGENACGVAMEATTVEAYAESKKDIFV